VAACFDDGGVYVDPTMPNGVSGAGVAAYARGLLEAFPDLSFEIVDAAQTDDSTVAVRWVMRGTNSGPLLGGPPTGGQIALPGVDFIRVAGDKVARVEGFFDQKTFVEQLGLQTVVQPYQFGPVTFGTSARFQPGSTAKPGAISATWIDVSSDEDKQKVIEYSRAIWGEMAGMRGFIGGVNVVTSNRLHTFTAREDADAPAQLLAGGARGLAMSDVFQRGLGEFLLTSVWVPQRLNRMLARCRACGRVSGHEVSDGVCPCGKALPPRPPYW